ncbi:MAG: 5'-3' exonuclease H3TH domain-containing protein, partial [Actinomycetota bacterium]
MEVHLLDGTYELFRQHYGQARHGTLRPGSAAAGVLATAISLLERGATHLGVASDHVIESFRNDLWPGYKTSAGMPPEILDAIPVLESALTDLGVPCWAMVEQEADDALAAAAAVAGADPRVGRVLIGTPDKDLAQCVRGTRVVQFDGRRHLVIDEDAVHAKFGVGPASIPDYLALVGDAADGFPGLPGWGARSAAAVLARYRHVEDVPADHADWDVPGLRNAATLAATLRERAEHARLFKDLATLRLDAPVGDVDGWRWRGPTPAFAATAARLGAPRLA